MSFGFSIASSKPTEDTLEGEPQPHSQLLHPHVESRPKHQDKAFVVLFLLQLLVVIGCSFSAGITALSSRSVDEVTVANDGTQQTQRGGGQSSLIIAGVFVSLAVAALLAVGWMQLMIHLASQIIICMLSSIILILLICSIAFFVSGSIVGGTVSLLAACFSAGWMYYVRPRIAFASANLKVACSSVLSMTSVVTYSVIMLAVQTVWCVLWIMAVLGVATNNRATSITAGGTTYDLSDCSTYKYSNQLEISDVPVQCASGTCYACVCDHDGVEVLVKTNSQCIYYSLNTGVYFALLLSLYWTCSVISNIVHCTTSGAVGSWWFHGASGSVPVRDAFVRACTTSLGPICFGSLLVATVRTLRAIVYTAQKTAKKSGTTGSHLASVVCMCTDFLLRIFDDLLGFVNRYAYCYVAIYGSSFIEAGRNVHDLFKDRGWTAIVNDDLIDQCLFLGSAVCACVVSVVSLAFGRIAGLSGSSLVVLCSAGVLIGFVMAMVMLKVINSAVATVFVLFAESPEAFRLTHAGLYGDLMQAWSRFYPQVMLDCGYSSSGSGTKDVEPRVRGTYKSPLLAKGTPDVVIDTESHISIQRGYGNGYSVLPRVEIDDLDDDDGEEATV